MNAHILIKKSKAGYRVLVKAKNEETLSVSEVLESRDNAYKNIVAQLKVFNTDCVVPVLETWSGDSYYVHRSGKKEKI